MNTDYLFAPRYSLMDILMQEPRIYMTVPEIKEIDYADRTTKITWVDGTSTVVHCGEGETYDRYTGFMAAVCKKLFGSTTAAKKIRDTYDSENLKRIANEIRTKADDEAKRKREKREKAAIKRRAKEIIIEREAQKLADLKMVH